MSYISSGNNITLKTTGDMINREGNILADKDVNITANNLINESYTFDIEIKNQWRRDFEIIYGTQKYRSHVDRKLKKVGETLIKIDTWSVKASQYNHVEDNYKKKKLSNRWNEIEKH